MTQGVTSDQHTNPRVGVRLLPRPLVRACVLAAVALVAVGLGLVVYGQRTVLTPIAAVLSVGAGIFLGLWMLPDVLGHRMFNKNAVHVDASHGLPPADACPPPQTGQDTHLPMAASGSRSTIVDLAEARRWRRP